MKSIITIPDYWERIKSQIDNLPDSGVTAQVQTDPPIKPVEISDNAIRGKVLPEPGKIYPLPRPLI